MSNSQVILEKGCSLFINGESGVKLATSVSLFNGMHFIKTISYEELVNERFSMYFTFRDEPEVVIVTDTPARKYVLDFIQTIISNPTVLCDVPRDKPVMKTTPHIICCGVVLKDEWCDIIRANKNFLLINC